MTIYTFCDHIQSHFVPISLGKIQNTNNRERNIKSWYG